MGQLIKPITKFDVKVYKCHEDAVLPVLKTEDAAGYDICTIEDFDLNPGQRIVVGTGLVVQPPPGFHTEVLIRSGMSFKYTVSLINSVGLIDRDYAGPEDELKVMLYRLPELMYTGDGNFVRGATAPEAISFKKGDRIAQLVFRETHRFNIVEVDEAPKRNRGGLGSTGK